MAAIARQILRAAADGTEEWKKQRTTGFGGTDAAQLHNGKKSRFALWREKAGLAEPEHVLGLHHRDHRPRREGEVDQPPVRVIAGPHQGA